MKHYDFSIFPNQNFVDLNLYQFGREKCTPAHSFGPAKRNHFLFHYVISGHGVLIETDEKGNTRSWRLQGGQGFLIFPNQINTYVADIRDPWEYVWLEFDGLRAKQPLEEAGLRPQQPVYDPPDPETGVTVREEMLYIVAHAGLPALHLIGHLYLFLDALTKSPAARTDDSLSKFREFYIREAIAYIESNYQNEMSIEMLAAAVGLNRSYLGKLFKASTGKTPQQFLMNYRMVKAAELLTLTQRPIGEIGAAVGYPSQMHFSRAFRAVHGMSPREWRGQHRSGGTKMFT